MSINFLSTGGKKNDKDNSDKKDSQKQEDYIEWSEPVKDKYQGQFEKNKSSALSKDNIKFKGDSFFNKKEKNKNKNENKEEKNNHTDILSLREKRLEKSRKELLSLIDKEKERNKKIKDSKENIKDDVNENEKQKGFFSFLFNKKDKKEKKDDKKLRLEKEKEEKLRLKKEKEEAEKLRKKQEKERLRLEREKLQKEEEKLRLEKEKEEKRKQEEERLRLEKEKEEKLRLEKEEAEKLRKKQEQEKLRLEKEKAEKLRKEKKKHKKSFFNILKEFFAQMNKKDIKVDYSKKIQREEVEKLQKEEEKLRLEKEKEEKRKQEEERLRLEKEKEEKLRLEKEEAEKLRKKQKEEKLKLKKEKPKKLQKEKETKRKNSLFKIFLNYFKQKSKNKNNGNIKPYSNQLSVKDRWKASKVLKTNLIKDEVVVFFDWKKNILYLFLFVFVSVLMVLGAYSALSFIVKSKQAEADKVAIRLEILNKKIQEAENDVRELELFKEKLKLVNYVLDEHLYWTNVFDFFEQNTLQNVFFHGFNGDDSGEYVLDATTKNFASIDAQIEQMLSNKYVIDAWVEEGSLHFIEDENNNEDNDENIKTNQEADVNFVLNLLLNREIFKQIEE